MQGMKEREQTWGGYLRLSELYSLKLMNSKSVS